MFIRLSTLFITIIQSRSLSFESLCCLIYKDKMIGDQITRHNYVYATPMTCDKNPQNKIEFDPVSDD